MNTRHERTGYRLFRATYRDRKGKARETADWYIEFRDQYRKPRRLPGFGRADLTEELGRNVVRLVAYFTATGGQTDPALGDWLATLPDRMRDKLAELGLLPGERQGAARPLAEHLADWRASMIARGCTEKHAALFADRAARAFDAMGAQRFGDVSGAALERYAAKLREGGSSERTAGFYIGSVGSFFRWAIRERRTAANPIAHVVKPRVVTEGKRRALSSDEQRALIAAAESGPVRFCIDGAERAMLYRVALGTGLRRSELGALTVASFDLNADSPTATLPATATKNRTAAVQPLPAELARLLGAFLSKKTPTARALRLPDPTCTSRMLRADLSAARAAWIADAADDAERAEREESDYLKSDTAAGKVDFHALRHSYIASLKRGGVSLMQAMQLARHCDPKLTAKVYGGLSVTDLRGAVDTLPTLTTPTPERMRATGTDHSHASGATGASADPVLAFCLAHSGAQVGNSVDSGGRLTLKSDDAKRASGVGENANFAENAELGSVRVPGGHHGLQNR